MEEQSEKIEALDLFMDLYENSKPRKEFPEISLLKPDFSEIGIKIRRESQEALKQAETSLANMETRFASRKISYNILAKSRIERDLILKKIEHEPVLIEYKELRAEIEWQKALIEELKERQIELLAKTDKQEREIALLEKHIFKKAKIGVC